MAGDSVRSMFHLCFGLSFKESVDVEEDWVKIKRSDFSVCFPWCLSTEKIDLENNVEG